MSVRDIRGNKVEIVECDGTINLLGSGGFFDCAFAFDVQDAKRIRRELSTAIRIAEGSEEFKDGNAPLL